MKSKIKILGLILTYLSFTLSPSSSATSFAVIGDFGVDNSAEQNVANLVDSWNPEFVVTMGDNDYSGGNYESTVKAYYGDYMSTNCNSNRFFPSFGNHDSTSSYNNIFPCTGKQYRVRKGDVEFFTINSDSSITTSVKDWLQNALADSTAPWKVVFFHHAAYSSGNHGSQSKMQLPYAQWGADVVMSGHDHHYERIEKNGIWYFVNGLGGRGRYSVDSPISGSKVLYNSNWGAMRVDTTATTFRIRFTNISGNLIDDHTINKSGGTAPVAGFSHSVNGLAVNFTDSSTDDGSITNRAWTFGDGATSTQTNPSHTYASAGTYAVKLTVTDNSGLTNQITKNVTVTDGSCEPNCPPADNELTNGVTKTGISGAAKVQNFFIMEVPAGASNLKFVTTGGTGDADLFVKFGSKPTLSVYDCKSTTSSSNETCSISNIQTGTYHVMVESWNATSNVSLTGSFDEATTPPDTTPIDESIAVSASENTFTYYTQELTAGYANLTISISGGSGDMDLYVRQGSQPTTSSYDCRPYKDGNSETCTFNTPAAGTYHIGLRGYKSNPSGVTLRVQAN